MLNAIPWQLCISSIKPSEIGHYWIKELGQFMKGHPRYNIMIIIIMVFFKKIDFESSMECGRFCVNSTAECNKRLPKERPESIAKKKIVLK